jgi:hypothetical protein
MDEIFPAGPGLEGPMTAKARPTRPGGISSRDEAKRASGALWPRLTVQVMRLSGAILA